MRFFGWSNAVVSFLYSLIFGPFGKTSTLTSTSKIHKYHKPTSKWKSKSNKIKTIVELANVALFIRKYKLV
jgi:hypothetical protein